MNICPVCNINLNNVKEDKILVCPNCENSLFVYKDKKTLKIRPFSLDLRYVGNSRIKNEFMDYNSLYFEDFDEEDDFY